MFLTKFGACNVKMFRKREIMRIFQTLKARLILVFGLVMLIVWLLATVFVDRLVVDKMRQEKFASLQSYATSVSAVISENLRERQREINLLAKAPFLRSGSINAVQLQTVLDELKSSYPQYAWIGYPRRPFRVWPARSRKCSP